MLINLTETSVKIYSNCHGQLHLSKHRHSLHRRWLGFRHHINYVINQQPNIGSATEYQPGYSENHPKSSLPTAHVQAQAQPSPQLVGFSSPHQVGYQPTAKYQPATKYQAGYSDDPQQSSLSATPVQVQVQPAPQLVGYPLQYQPTSQYQPMLQYQQQNSINQHCRFIHQCRVNQ